MKRQMLNENSPELQSVIDELKAMDYPSRVDVTDRVMEAVSGQPESIFGTHSKVRWIAAAAACAAFALLVNVGHLLANPYNSNQVNTMLSEVYNPDSYNGDGMIMDESDEYFL